MFPLKTKRSITKKYNVKKLLGLFMLGTLLIGLTGCGSSTGGGTAAGTANPPAQTGTSSAIGSSGAVSGSQIDPEQPERVAEVYGKVKSIQGNEVLIAEMQRQQSGAQLSEEDRAKRREQMQALSEEERQSLQAAQEVTTGKNLTITVPVGIPVKVKTTGTGGTAVEDGTIASIKTGSIVNIWTETEDPATAEYVSISTR